MKRAIDIDELIRHNRALEAQFVEDGKRIAELEEQNKRLRAERDDMENLARLLADQRP